MKQYYFSLILLVCFGVSAEAQITLSNGGFPYEGDTLVTATDNMPSISFDATATGEQSWDFQDLVAPFSTELIFEDPSGSTVGSEFPTANAYVLAVGGVENFYEINGDEVLNLGYYGDDPAGIGLNALVRFSPPLIERRAPVSYQDEFSSESNALFPFAADDVPFDFLDSLPISPDSFRILINREAEEVYDAYGTVELEVGSFNVLKMKRVETVNVRLEAKIPFFNWQDITDLVGLSDFLGEQVIHSHHFFSNTAKEPLVVITMEPDTEDVVQTVSFKSGGSISSLGVQHWSKPNAFIYPNPVFFEAKFELVNIPNGEYELAIYNIIGSKVKGQTMVVNGNKTIKMDVSDLRQGTYLYALESKEGQRLFTRKMTVIKP